MLISNCLLRTALFAAAAVLLAMFAISSRAFATLGEGAASVGNDQTRMRASIRVSSANAYTVHELQSPTGTVVREYVSPAGTVFAVAWQGPSLPDLRQVLGKYFDQYVQAMQKRGRRGPALIQTPGLVVQVGGHQRALSGRAYVPQSLPSGVRQEEIR